jgi:hypothetical protein
MRSYPRGISRKVIKRDDYGLPSWYEVLLDVPGADAPELLGRTERLPRARWWRVHPVTGEFPQPQRGWVNTIDWLLQVREGHRQTTDTATAAETEHVGIDLSHCAVLTGTELDPAEVTRKLGLAFRPAKEISIRPGEPA